MIVTIGLVHFLNISPKSLILSFTIMAMAVCDNGIGGGVIGDGRSRPYDRGVAPFPPTFVAINCIAYWTIV